MKNGDRIFEYRGPLDGLIRSMILATMMAC